jgi:hypothetical protein
MILGDRGDRARPDRQATGESMCTAVSTASIDSGSPECYNGSSWVCLDSFRLTLVIAAFSSLSNDIDIFGYGFVDLAGAVT